MILWFVLMSLLFPQSNAQNSSCSANKADIIFLLDSSTSEGETNFRKQLDFVTNFTKAYQIGPSHVQVGIFTFSSTPQVAFYLNTYSDKASLIQGINSVKYLSGNTYTDLALKLVREDGFIPIHGSRTGVPKILVVMTDGESTSPRKTEIEATTLHYTDIKVISIGIGSSVQIDELRTIASDNEHVFTVPSFDSLQSIENEIQKQTCVDEIIDTCDSKQADIVFILDSSSSEGEANFRKQLELVKNVTETFIIGPNNTQVSIVTFATDEYNEFFLNEHTNKQDLLNAIGNVTYYGGGTHTEKALQFVRLNSFKPENGGRPSPVSKLVIVITDGNSYYPSQTKTQAELLQHTGVQVMSVGIGSSITQAELNNIATDQQHVFAVANFDLLSTVQKELENVACKTTSECGDKPADIVFLLDGSSSEGQANFQKQIDFVTNFVKSFDVGPSNVQFGLVVFSTAARTEFFLDTYKDKASMIAGIQSTNYVGGSTHTDNALRYTRYFHFTTEHGSRDNATKILILLTDGQSIDTTRTINEADLLKKAGVKILAVGIGSQVNNNELNGVATDRNHVFSVGNFDLLHSFVDEIKQESCGEIKPTPTPVSECGKKPADIVFVLDSSSSEGPTNFQKQLDFVRDFIYQFTIGPNAIQVSVVVFSSDTHEEFPLNKYQDQATLLSAVAQIQYIQGATYTDKALSYVRQHSFTTLKGVRQNATHLVIVLTDGASTNPADTSREANLLKSQPDKVVISVGIGSYINQTELETIATDRDHALNVKSFDALDSIKSELTYVACKTCDFIAKADIVFVLDASSSEGQTNFDKQLDFVARVANDFNIGPRDVQIGVITYAYSPNLEFYLNRYSTKSSLLSAIQRIPYTSGNTRTDLAIKYVADQMFLNAHGDRPDANDYVIILTDGASTQPNDTLREAQNLKQQGATVLSIGIGSSVNKAELNGIASDKHHVFTVDSFDALKTIREDVKKAACEVVSQTVTPEYIDIITPPATVPAS
ncbi:hypothetical protein ACF0H5_003409 [Mactra antiquata]